MDRSRRQLRWAMLALSALATALPGASRPASAATALEVYGKLPSLEDVVLSTDGKKLAYVRTVGDERIVAVHELGGTKQLFGARVGAIKLRSLRWADDDHLLIMVSSTSYPPFGFTGGKHEWYQLLSGTISKNKLSPIALEVSGERTFNVVASAPMIRTVGGRTTLFIEGYYVTYRVLPALFRVDLDSSHVGIVARSDEPSTHWLVDADGQLAAEMRYHDSSREWVLDVRREGRLHEAARGTAPLDVPEVLGFDARGESLLVRFIENDEPEWRPWRLKDSAWDTPLGRGKVFWHALSDDHSGRIVGGSFGIDEDQYTFFDNELQAHWDAVLRAFPADERVDLISASSGWSRMVLRVFGPKDGYAYYLFDWYTHRMLPLAPVYEGLGAVAEVRRIAYPAADGFSIPAYLTLPPGTVEGAHALPLVVLPHGGPAVADSRRFDWWAQALANEGYVVLQPNFRGSTVTRAHLSAGFGEWGRKMQSDLSDGVRHLSDTGLIDPKRVCIVGASYGGYAALAGMTLQPGTYRCGVSVAGLSDLRAMMHWTRELSGRSENYTERYWDRFMGVAGPDDPRLKEISPIEHVGAVSGPVLLIHGKDDTVVPYHQSELMEKALRKAGKSVQLVTLKEEDHWLSRSATRLQMLEATVAFLRANNPP